MDPITQLMNSIPGLQGSIQDMNRNTLTTLQNNGYGDAWWLPDFITQQTAAGWL